MLFRSRARADLVLSLHFDGYVRPAARGATAWCPPATYGERAPAGRPGVALPVEVLPWRDVATRHAVPARALAEAVRAALELDGLGPVRVRERLALPLLGVNAPGLVLECATLTSPADRARVTSPEGLRALAASLATAVAESFRAGAETEFDHPCWTRPPEFRGLEVPAVLQSGDHAAIAAWRAAQRSTRS